MFRYKERFAILTPGLAALFALAACSSDRPASPDEGPPVLSGVQGNSQITTVGTEVPLPLTLRVTSGRGAPLKGKIVTWTATDGGSVSPDQSTTDDSGTVRATWTLGQQVGRQSALAAFNDTSYRFVAIGARALAVGEPRAIELSTFDGSGQVVHPDVARVPRGWAAARRFLAVTPYPSSDRTLEEPSIFASGDVSAWDPPSGVRNPLARAKGENYLSDPDLVFDPDARVLVLYYRLVTKSNNVILQMRSPDGTHWTTPSTVLTARNHALISPSIVRTGPNQWHMWVVNAGTSGCDAPATVVDYRSSVDGKHWSAATSTVMSDAPMYPWHIDVAWIADRHEFWALFNGKPEDSCSTPALYLATSPDGLTWHTLPSPVVSRGVIPEFRDIVYRSALEYDARSDVVTIWMSGAAYLGGQYVWRAAVERFDRAALFAIGEKPVAFRPLNLLGGPPKLMIAP